MICRSCLRRVSALRPSAIARPVSTSPHNLSPPAETTSPSPTLSTGLAQPFSNPLTPSPGAEVKSKSKLNSIPISICPAGTVMKGLNYMKGRDDPVALPEEEYPEWLWRCLDAKVTEEEDGGGAGDEFSKSKKLRRKAAKAQRKLAEKLLASGDTSSLLPKIPLTKQSIDLPANEAGTLEGALEADAKREELRAAMRRERRAKIKETNFLKGM